MELTYEKGKSILLTVLVVTSVILTWNLWSYQPLLERSGDRSMVEGVLLSEKKDIKEIVRVEQIMLNLEGDYYGTLSTEKIDNIMKAISSWEFRSFDNLSLDKKNIDALAEGHETMQIIYPGEIPMELFASIYKLDGNKIPNFYFNKILIDFKPTNFEYGNVYFISEENQQVYSSHVLSAFLNQFSTVLFEEAKQYKKYFPFQTGTGRTIYLPEGQTELVNNQYLFKPLSVDDLKDALFSDPRIVEKTFISIGEEYTDGRKLMIVDDDRHSITYIDPSAVESQETNTDGLLQKSIDFVNNHGGWTDNYRFVQFEKGKKIAHFRIYGPDGYPVFGENNPISKIEVEWGSSEVSRYSRNDFSLGLLTLNPIKTLESGHEAIKKIQEQEGEQFNPSLLEDIKIGYKMTMDAKTTSLEPGWFYLYSGEWKPVEVNAVGGEKVGLE